MLHSAVANSDGLSFILQRGYVLQELPLSINGKTALDVTIGAAREAGALLRERFHTAKEVSYKGPSNLVTDVDLASERLLQEIFAREFPDFGFLGEEFGEQGDGTGLRWIVDPVDGTRNYALGVPHFAVSIALVNGSDALLGVTYDPIRDELFHTAKGEGAFLNGKRLSVTGRTSVAESLLGFDMSAMDDKAVHALKLVQGLWPGLQGVRVMGSATLGLAYTAAGRLDIYFHHTVAPWDVAAGILMVQEAGGVVCDHHGGPASLESTRVVTSNPRLLEEFLRLTGGMDQK